MVSNTMDDFPEPDTPVKMVIFRFGICRETFLRLFSRAPLISMNSCCIVYIECRKCCNSNKGRADKKGHAISGKSIVWDLYRNDIIAAYKKAGGENSEWQVVNG